jgi:hypothetical protein
MSEPVPVRPARGPGRAPPVRRDSGEALPVPAPVVTVGRAPACEVVVDDDSVSDRHARLAYEGGRLVGDRPGLHQRHRGGRKARWSRTSPRRSPTARRCGWGGCSSASLPWRRPTRRPPAPPTSPPAAPKTLREERSGARFPVWLLFVVAVLAVVIAIIVYTLVARRPAIPAGAGVGGRPAPPRRTRRGAVKLRWRAAGDTHVGRVRRGERGRLPRGRGARRLPGRRRDGRPRGGRSRQRTRRRGGGWGAYPRGWTADWKPTRWPRRCAIRSAPPTARSWRTPPRPRRIRGMGTTLTACVLCSDGTYRLGHVGDSRGLPDAAPASWRSSPATTPWCSARWTPGASPRPARGATTWRTSSPAPSAPTPATSRTSTSGRLEAGDLLLLTTDGLTGPVTDRNLSRILLSGLSIEERVERMIRAANRRGGRDNITAVLVEVVETDTARGWACPSAALRVGLRAR